MHRIVTAIFPLLLIALSANPLAADAPAALPRYSFPVGRQLTYAGGYQATTAHGDTHTAVDLQITVIARNPDGSARLLVREDTKEQHAVGDTDWIRYGQFDLTADGRLIASAGDMEELPELLPRLPANAHEMDGGWTADPQLPGASVVFHIPPPSAPQPPNIYTFAGSTEGDFKKMYGMTRETTFRFDMAKGMIADLSAQVSQEYGVKQTGVATAKLVKDEMLSPGESAALAKDIAAFVSAESKTSDAMNAIRATPAGSAAIAGKLKNALADLAAGVTDPGLKTAIDNLRTETDEDAKDTADDAQRTAAMVGHPAPENTGTDLSGVSHNLSEFHGVVVLDFWYRGCPWCIRSMPQMKQVADDFAGKPVVILGMNTDADPADAKFVVDAMKLNYSTLRIDRETALKFKVEAFPSLLIIDQTGIIRHFDEGYSPTLRADLDKKIQALLDGSAVAPEK